jgi:hypothetical protein
MKFILYTCFCILLVLTGCQQKKFTITIQKLEEKELRVYFAKKGFPKLQLDDKGNYSVNFDTSNIVNTSTDFKEVKNLRDKFCIKELNECPSEDFEIEEMGFIINGYSHFTSDSSGKEAYINPYHVWLIEKRK